MAVAVELYFAPIGDECVGRDPAAVGLAGEELVDQERVAGEVASRRGEPLGHEIGILVAKRQDRRRLDAHERGVGSDHTREQLDVAAREVPGGADEPLGEMRPAAVDMVGHDDLPAEGLEQFDRLDADRGVERVGELVAKEMHAAMRRGRPPRRPAGEPAAERDRGQRRQRPARMEPKHLLHDRRDAWRRDGEVVEPGGDSRAAERRRALGHEPRTERDTAGIVHMLLPLRLEPGHVDVRRAL